jgi:carboxylesterase type B
MHLADVPYFLGEVKAGQERYDTEDEGLSIDLMQCLAAFVKTLDPSLPEPSPQWPTWTPKHPQYLEIGDDIQSRSFRDPTIINLFRKQLGQ